MHPIAVWFFEYWWVLPIALFAALGVAMLIAVPLQARRRGHGFWSWFLLQIVAMNPFYPLILVAMLPNKARLRLREQFARELDQLLAKAESARPTPNQAVSAAGGATIGDVPTTGDVRNRSLGDDETRGG